METKNEPEEKKSYQLPQWMITLMKIIEEEKQRRAQDPDKKKKYIFNFE